MTHFCARFPQNDGPTDEPCQYDYVDASRFLLAKAHRLTADEGRRAILLNAWKFERVARRYNWMRIKS
jgi:hypothetical protein